MFEKGHIFLGPDGSGYILTRPVKAGDYVLASDFEPFGNAPEPVTGREMPRYLAEAIQPKKK